MQFLLTNLASAVVLLYAATAATAAPSKQSRDADSLLCLFMTSGPNWTGEGLNICEEAGQCSKALPDGLTGNVSSAGPSDSNVACFLYDEEGCTGQRSGAISYPGYADLKSIGFGTEAQSWACWRLCGDDGEAPVLITTTLSESKATSTSTSSGVKITATISPTSNLTANRAAAEAGDMSITTTLTGSQPLATAEPSTTSTTSSSPTPSITTTRIDGAPLPPLSKTPTPFDPSTSSTSSGGDAGSITSTLQTIPTPPTNGAFTSVFTVTHTYADGSTTVLTQTMVEPVAPTL